MLKKTYDVMGFIKGSVEAGLYLFYLLQLFSNILSIILTIKTNMLLSVIIETLGILALLTRLPEQLQYWRWQEF